MTSGIRVLALVLFAATALGCRDAGVVTHAYATLAEATSAGAVDRGFVPRGLPPGAREIREAHDEQSGRRWGLFNFPQDQSDVLRALLDAELPLQGVRCDPPRRIEWWPVLLRGALDEDQVKATGGRAYRGRDGALIFVVNWNQGRAYYWAK